MEIEQARLLVLKTAWMIDNVGAKGAAKEIAMIKAVVPSVLGRVVDHAQQTFGAMGLTPDAPLVELYGMPLAPCVSPTARTKSTSAASPDRKSKPRRKILACPPNS